MTSTAEPMIHAAMAAAFANIRGVGKDGYNPGQKFHFRSIDDVAAAAKAALEAQGVYIAPNYEILTTNDTGKGMHIFVKGHFTFYAKDGSCVTACAIGEGRDSYDKATNKAMSAAFKYALLQTFCIGDPADEGDAQSAPVETVAKKTATRKKPEPQVTEVTTEVSAKEWGEWLATRERITADDDTKSRLGSLLKVAGIKVDRTMSKDDFDTLLCLVDEAMGAEFALPSDD